jgi:hypothetical protein
MTSSLETETRDFMRAAHTIRTERRKAVPDTDGITDSTYEIEGTALNTESARLRARCTALLTELAQDQAAATA